MGIEKTHLLQGTLDMLILKIVALGPVHGYGISQRIHQISKEVLVVQQGSLYPALHRLEQRGWLDASWGESDNGRQAKFYRLSVRGKKQLLVEEINWRRLSQAVGLFSIRRGDSMKKRWRDLFHKRDVDPDSNANCPSISSRLVDDKIETGMPPELARREAVLEFGGRGR